MKVIEIHEEEGMSMKECLEKLSCIAEDLEAAVKDLHELNDGNAV